MGSVPSVFVVDDDPLLLALVGHILKENGFLVCAFQRASDFLQDFQRDRRGCLILDIQMPGLSGPELQRELLARDILIPIIFLSATADVVTSIDIMKRGAEDLLLKPIESEKLVAAVRKALVNEQTAFDERRRREEFESRLQSLTLRERQVLDLVVIGHANKKIALELQLSEKTIEIHRSHVMKKMQAGSLAELVRQTVDASSPPK